MLSLRRIFIIINIILLEACGGGATNTAPTSPSASTATSINTSSSATSSSASSTHTESSSNINSSFSYGSTVSSIASSSDVITSSSKNTSSAHTESSSSYINSSSSSSLSSSFSSSNSSSSSSKNSAIRFKSDFSSQCLSVAVTGSSITQYDCESNLAQWEIIPIKGDLYRISSKTNGLCLSIENDEPAGKNLIQLPCNDTIKTRLWHFNLVTKISLVSDNTDLLSYELKNGASFLCVDIFNKSQVISTQLSQTLCTRANNQHWRVLGTVPDTADRIDLNLLVITKVASKIPGMPERTTTQAVRDKQRFWSETALPRYFHDYTNGRVKLNVYYYESPYLLTKLADKYAVSAQDIPEDLDLVVNPGWFDGVFINHAAPVAGGLVTFGILSDGFYTGFSNVPIDDGSSLFLTNDIAELGATIHEFSHQLEYYYSIVPERRKLTDLCAPVNNSMLDCGANEPQGGNFTENTDGLGTWLAFYRDFLNGYLWQGKGALGDDAWSSNHKPREYNPEYVPGGPLAPIANQSTCLNLNTFSSKYIADLSGNNNFATINNINKSINSTGESFLFDGIDDYIRISNLVGDNFTISMWLKSAQLFPAEGSDGISLVYAGAEDRSGFELRGFRNAINIDTIKFIAGDYSAIVSTSDITTNTWIHIAVSRNQTTGITTLYINGKKEAEGNTGTQRLNQNPLIKIGSAFQYPKIGQTILNNDHFKGEMADICILNSAYNSTEIAQLAQARKTQSSAAGTRVFLSDMPLFSGTTGWGAISFDKALTGNPIVLDGTTYNKGLGVHAPSKLVYHLNKRASRFISDIGIDDEANINVSSAEFKIYGDKKLLYRSASKYDTDKIESINIDISDVDELTLITTEGDNRSGYADITDWGNAQIILK